MKISFTQSFEKKVGKLKKNNPNLRAIAVKQGEAYIFFDLVSHDQY